MTFSQLHRKKDDRKRGYGYELEEASLPLRSYCRSRLFWQIYNQVDSQISLKIFDRFGGYRIS